MITIAYTKPKELDGDDYSNRKLTPKQHRKLRRKYQQGYPASKLSREFNISESTVYDYMDTRPSSRLRGKMDRGEL